MKLDIQKFAGSTLTFGASGSLQGRVVWSSTSNGAVANSSNVSATLQIHRTDGYSTTGVFTGTLNINGDNRGWSWSGTLRSDWVSVSAFTITVKHNSDGSKSCYIGGSVTGPSGTSLAGKTSSGGANVTLDKIARFATMTGASNFNDEGTPSFTFSNPANTHMSCWLEVNPNSEHLAVRTFSGTSGTYRWTLTEEERNKLRSKIPNSNSATCRIGLYSTLGGSTQASYKDVKFNIVNANPTFDNFEFTDTNNDTVQLTGNNKNIIIGYSTINAVISTSDKATANKSATMNKYRFVIDNQNLDINYSENSSVNGSIQNATSGVFDMYAIDSRNNSTKVTKLANQIIQYTPINLISSQCKVERNDSGVGKYAILTLNGEIWNDSFGSVTNSIKSISYEYKKTSDTQWETGLTTITPTVSDNSFSWSGQVASLESDYSFELNSSYDFRITVEDELSIKVIQLTPMASGIPNISFADDGVGIMCDYDENLGGLLQVGGKVIDEEVYSTTEKDTGKKWINNKPIYRKVFQFTSANNTSWNLLDSNNYNMIVNLYGEYIATEHYPFEQGFKIYWFNGKIYYQASGTFQQQRSCTVSIEYTKTTD